MQITKQQFEEWWQHPITAHVRQQFQQAVDQSRLQLASEALHLASGLAEDSTKQMARCNHQSGWIAGVSAFLTMEFEDAEADNAE